MSFRRWLNLGGTAKPRLTYEFGRQQVIESRVRTALVIVLPPGVNNCFCVVQRFEPMQVQTLVPE